MPFKRIPGTIEVQVHLPPKKCQSTEFRRNLHKQLQLEVKEAASHGGPARGQAHQSPFPRVTPSGTAVFQQKSLFEPPHLPLPPTSSASSTKKRKQPPQEPTEQFEEIQRGSAQSTSHCKRQKIKVKEIKDEIGTSFMGAISKNRGVNAYNVAMKIDELPIPPKVTKRLAMFTDGSIRTLCGAASVVWRSKGSHPNFETRGIWFPFNSDEITQVEMLGVAFALETALDEFSKPESDVHRGVVDYNFFHLFSRYTDSQHHHMDKELYVFTDNAQVLQILRGDEPEGSEDKEVRVTEIAGVLIDLVSKIYRLSQILHARGVHLELHLSPGHRGIPGNEVADRQAKFYRMMLEEETTWHWPINSPLMPKSLK